MRLLGLIPHKWRPTRSIDWVECDHCGIGMTLSGPQMARAPTVCFEQYERGIRRFVWNSSLTPTPPETSI